MDLEAPFPPERCRFKTNRIEAKWYALNRWMRRKCGGRLPSLGDWDLYIIVFQRRTWFRGHYVPLLLDTIRMITAASWEDARAGEAQAWGLLLQNAIDLAGDGDI